MVSSLSLPGESTLNSLYLICKGRLQLFAIENMCLITILSLNTLFSPRLPNTHHRDGAELSPSLCQGLRLYFVMLAHRLRNKVHMVWDERREGAVYVGVGGGISKIHCALHFSFSKYAVPVVFTHCSPLHFHALASPLQYDQKYSFVHLCLWQWWLDGLLLTSQLIFYSLSDQKDWPNPCSTTSPRSSKQCPAAAVYNMTSHKLYPIYFYAALSPVKIGLVLPFSSWKERGTDKPQFNLFWQLLEISHGERSPCLSVRNDIQPYGPRQKETLLFCKSIQACIDILAEVAAHSHLNGEKRETRT